MHPESKVFIRGQQGQMTEATGGYRGFTHIGDTAKHIQKMPMLQVTQFIKVEKT